MKYAGYNLQQRAFAGAVLTYYAEGLARLNFKTNVVESGEVVMEGNAIQAQQFLQAGARGRVNWIGLRNTTKLNDWLRH